MSAASNGFTASERADMALLRSAGMIAGNIDETGLCLSAPASSTKASKGSLTAQERADMALMRAAGITKPDIAA